MHLTLRYRGPGHYALLEGAREVGSLEGATLRFGPFENEADRERAEDAGHAALRRWLEGRPRAREDSDGRALAAPVRDDGVERGRGPYVEFSMPPGVYAAVALHVAQGILQAIRESALDGEVAVVTSSAA